MGLVPKNIGDLLTPIGLVYWGTRLGNKVGSGFRLNTHSFTLELEENQFLIQIQSNMNNNRTDFNWDYLQNIYIIEN